MPRSIDAGLMGRTTQVTINSGVAIRGLPPSPDIHTEGFGGHRAAAELHLCKVKRLPAAAESCVPRREARDADRSPLTSKDAGGVSSHWQEAFERQ